MMQILKILLLCLCLLSFYLYSLSLFAYGFMHSLNYIEVSEPYYVDDGKNEFRIKFKIGPFYYEKTLKQMEIKK